MPYSRRIDSDEYRSNNADTHPSVNPAAKKHRARKRVGGSGKVRITINLAKRRKSNSRKRVATKR